MRVLLLCNEAANQRALASRLHQSIPLSAVAVVDSNRGKPEPKFQRLLRGVVGYPLRRAWTNLFHHYDDLYPCFPDVTLSHHDGIEAESIKSLVFELQPDLVLVSGTSLLRRPLIAAIKRFGRVINLHTGISPYIKGGPNCTSWALAIGRPDLIGNTIMWLDAGIDSGNIICTERTPLTGEESLSELHRKVMDHAHDLYIRAAGCLVAGEDVPSVKQTSLGGGRLFLSKDWTAAAALKAVINFYSIYSAKRLRPQGVEELVNLPIRNWPPSA